MLPSLWSSTNLPFREALWVFYLIYFAYVDNLRSLSITCQVPFLAPSSVATSVINLGALILLLWRPLGRLSVLAFNALLKTIPGWYVVRNNTEINVCVRLMLAARIFNGIGTGILNAITPVWATETAEHTSRGQFVAIEFTLNIFGVVVAYWIE